MQQCLNLKQTLRAVCLIKDLFPLFLAKALGLRRVAAPILVPAGSGINDDLNGEKPVSFTASSLPYQVEIVQSLGTTF